MRPAVLARPLVWCSALVILAAGGGCGRLGFERNQAQTFVVDTAADGADADPTDGECRTASGACTLRAAIDQANAFGAADRPHRIDLGSGSAGEDPCTSARRLVLDHPLPPPTVPIILGSGDDPSDDGGAPPLTIVDGGNRLPYGLRLGPAASTSEIRDLVIVGFLEAGIDITGDDVRVIRNHIGVDCSGNVGNGNAIGIRLAGHRNQVGGVRQGNGCGGDCNLIGDNDVGVLFAGGSDNWVSGNFVGSNGAGTAAIGNGTGLSFAAGWGEASSAHLVGGTAANRGNLISGNQGCGIFGATEPNHDHRIEGNLIGLDATGQRALGNSGDGVCAEHGFRNIEYVDNVVSGNGGSGFAFHTGGTDGHHLRGNRIGTDRDGRMAIPNQGHGVFVDGGDGVRFGDEDGVRGLRCDGACNLVSGNTLDGIHVTSTGLDGDGPVDGFGVFGAFLGTSVDGLEAVANGRGIYVEAGMAGFDIRENVIAGNRGEGLLLVDVTVTSNFGSRESSIGHNLISASSDGLWALPNGVGSGISIYGLRRANGDLDSPLTLDGNVVVASAEHGIDIRGPDTGGLIIEDNLIGLHPAGAPNLENGGRGLGFDGIHLEGIEGAVLDSNVLAGHDGDAIRVATSHGITMRSNSSFRNRGLGINLVGGDEDSDGVTANDALDADDGANDLQNFPVLTAITVRDGVLALAGQLEGAPEETYVVEVLALTTPHPSGHGEARRSVCVIEGVGAGGSGLVDLATLTPACEADLAGDTLFTSLATNSSGSTSEFGPVLDLAPLP